jgi:hypothetical protein
MNIATYNGELEIAAVCRWFHRFMIEKQEINEA